MTILLYSIHICAGDGQAIFVTLLIFRAKFLRIYTKIFLVSIFFKKSIVSLQGFVYIYVMQYIVFYAVLQPTVGLARNFVRRKWK